MPPKWTARANEDGTRQMFTGGADAMLEDAASFRAVGMKHLIVYLQQPTIEKTLETQQHFTEDVISKS